MFAIVPKVFPHGHASVGRKKLERGRITGRCRYNGGEFHGSSIFQRFDNQRKGCCSAFIKYATKL